MNFTEIKGNLFDRPMGPNDYYVHCISRDYACGAGIAKEFNKRYDLTNILRKSGTDDLTPIVYNVINLVTKNKYWQKPTYKSLEDCLWRVWGLVVNYPMYYPNLLYPPKTLVMPRIGCGLDKLQWEKVKNIIKNIFKDTDVNIEVYYL